MKRTKVSNFYLVANHDCYKSQFNWERWLYDLKTHDNLATGMTGPIQTVPPVRTSKLYLKFATLSNLHVQ